MENLINIKKNRQRVKDKEFVSKFKMSKLFQTNTQFAKHVRTVFTVIKNIKYLHIHLWHSTVF